MRREGAETGLLMDVPEIRELVIECFTEILVSRGTEPSAVAQLINQFAEDTVDELTNDGKIWTYMKMEREEAKQALLAFMKGT